MDIELLKEQLLTLCYDIGPVYLAIGVIILTTILLLFIVRSNSYGDAVLFLGLCDSGKTSLFSLLTAGKMSATQTSILPNKSRLLKGSKSWGIIDLPGHERLRSKYLYEHKDNARGVIFMVDSVKFPKEIRDVAEFMYDVLANRTMKKNKISILVACNKQDLTTAKACSVIKMQLEKELTNLRQTRSAALLGIDDYSSSKNAFIGKQGKDFEFVHVHPIKVDFCECSLKNENDDENDLEEIEKWLKKL